MRFFRRSLFLALSLSCAFPGLVQAQSTDGQWRCVANGNIPIGIVTIQGTSYDFVTTNVSWQPQENASNGGGSLRFEGGYILPQDGPLLTEFEVNGAFNADGHIRWANNFGALMVCYP